MRDCGSRIIETGAHSFGPELQYGTDGWPFALLLQVQGMFLILYFHSLNLKAAIFIIFKVGLDKEGLLQAVDMTIVTDCGFNFNEGTAAHAAMFAKNCYTSKAWKFSPKLAKTDTPSNTYCRAPGQLIMPVVLI